MVLIASPLYPIIVLMGVVFAAAVVVFVVLPFSLACVAHWRSLSPRRQHPRKQPSPLLYSTLCVGRVWHTRLQPKRHAFTYPIFMFALDLQEVEGGCHQHNRSRNNNFHDTLWPLSLLVRFRPNQDHLKNGEGNNQGEKAPFTLSLAQRILRLVSEKTSQTFQPTLESHRILMLTHLCYYGYNFNPVSFYYVVNRANGRISAVVGEVSNTPWMEMYCYVLHPDSTNGVQTEIKHAAKGAESQVDYSFPKEFHVSPFMEMDYWYDWSFVNGAPKAGKEITVINSLRSRSTDQLAFRAKLELQCTPIMPLAIAWQLIRLPFFCAIIQVWIHWEALLLFTKGIVYVPHPEGSETVASKLIASIMTPFFAIRDSTRPKSKTKAT